jgi:carbonic anhydrase
MSNNIDSNKKAVINNIQYQIDKLQQNSSATLERLIKTGRLKILSTFYDIDTGQVQFLG